MNKCRQRSQDKGRRNGFFLIYEMLCFAASSILVATAAQNFSACLQAQERALEIWEASHAACLAAADTDAGEKFLVAREEQEYQEQKILEVRVYAKDGGTPLCSFLQAQP